jgi:hypothetical protein
MSNSSLDSNKQFEQETDNVLYVPLLDVAEDLAIAELVRERAAADTGRRTSLEEVAAKFGIDLDTL